MFEQMLSHMTFVDVFNWSVLLVFSICYIYQFYYVFVVLTRRNHHGIFVIGLCRKPRPITNMP